MKASSFRWLLVLVLVAPLNGCGGCGGKGGGGGGDPGGGGGGGGTNPSNVADIDVDSNRDGSVDNTDTDDLSEDAWSTSKGAVYYYNIDDEDFNKVEDYKDATVNGANDATDLARVWLRMYAGGADITGGTVTVLVGPAAAQGSVKIHRYSGAAWSQVYTSGASFTVPVVDITTADIELGIEAQKRIQATWDGSVTLTLELRNSGGVLQSSDLVVLHCAPFLMATNLWKTDQCVVVSIIGGGSANGTFRTQLQGACSAAGVSYAEAPGSTYANDRWIQDSHEPGIVYLPSASGRRRVDDVLQLARWRPVDAWCKDVLFNPDFDFVEVFSANSSSMNYGGNLEVVPPHTDPGSVAHDWGRIIVGGGTSNKIGTATPVTRLHAVEYREYYNALKYQGSHLQIHTEWLAVGHVDEVLCFLPAPNTARGWVVVLSSTALAKTILQNLQTAGGGGNTVFTGRTGWQTTVNAILADTALMTYNQEVQLRLDEIRSYLKTNVGLVDSEIIDIPTLYEDVGSANAAAYNPGVANIMPLVTASGAMHLVIPDPEGPDGPTDVWQADITPKLQALGTAAKPVTLYYVDVFFSYHTLLGECHCGTNTVRTPPAMDWWDK